MKEIRQLLSWGWILY